jgi:hypothetical protein
MAALKKGADLPIIPVVLCSCLKNAVPGKLPPKLLRAIEGKGKLHQCAADAYEAMDAAANAEGIDLVPNVAKPTHIAVWRHRSTASINAISWSL